MTLNENKPFMQHHSNPTTIYYIANALIKQLTDPTLQVIVLCIGTDRSTGDSLGPQTGTMLTANKPDHLLIFGTLHQPIHALNIAETMEYIHAFFDNPYIIAIDAALGKLSSIGNLISTQGPLLPGAALKKDLPAVGDFSLTGVVNCRSTFDFTVLQSTRLSLVYDMAHTLSKILHNVDLHLTFLRKKASLNQHIN